MSKPLGRFFWKLFLGNVLLVIAVVGVGTALLLFAFERFYVGDTAAHLLTVAETVRHQVQDRLTPSDRADLDRLAKALGSSNPEGLRVTFVLADGVVLGDSQSDPARMNSHADRAEIIQALAQGRGESTRWSDTLRCEMNYVAVRVGTPERPRGVVRVSMAAGSIAARTQLAKHLLWTLVVVIMAAAAVLALGLARLWSKPLRRISETAQSLSRGDLSAQAEVRGSDEIAQLGHSLNRMRSNLARQLDTIDRQRRTLESLLAQLHEGVVVAGADGRIRLLNPAAARLLGVNELLGRDDPAAPSLSVESRIPHRDLREMLTSAGTDKDAERSSDRQGTDTHSPPAQVEERRVSLQRSGGPVWLLARASDITLPRAGDVADRSDMSLRPEASASEENGRLLVLTDITDLTRTMQVKSDFAANASHELRTPLAAIRAAVETVMSLDLETDSAFAAQLLNVIDRHSNRLEAMVIDLLDLSRLESPSGRFEPATLKWSEVLDELRTRFVSSLRSKNLQWRVELPDGLATVVASPRLLRLTLDNLVDNAIKFTEEGGGIAVLCRGNESGFAVTVEDNGCGIPLEEHDRVFERFYQVERARTKTALRGTGLGLSIVRHAVNVLHGTIHLDSAPGRGTRVTFTVPQPRKTDSAATLLRQ